MLKLRDSWSKINKTIQDTLNAPSINFVLEDNFAILKVYLRQTSSSVAILPKCTDNMDFKNLTITKI